MLISDLLGQYQNSTPGQTKKLNEGGTRGVQKLVSALRDMGAGTIFEGTVNSMKDGKVVLGLSNGQQIHARLDGSVPLTVGQSMFFQVKTNDGAQIAIRPFTVDGNSVNLTLMNALAAANLPATEENLSMVNTMMREQMPIDANSLNQMARMVQVNRDINIQTLVQMKKFDIPVTREMASQFENYLDGRQAISKAVEGFFQELPQVMSDESFSLSQLRQMNSHVLTIITEGLGEGTAASGNAAGTADVGDAVLPGTQSGADASISEQVQMGVSAGDGALSAGAQDGGAVLAGMPNGDGAVLSGALDGGAVLAGMPNGDGTVIAGAQDAEGMASAGAQTTEELIQGAGPAEVLENFNVEGTHSGAEQPGHVQGMMPETMESNVQQNVSGDAGQAAPQTGTVEGQPAEHAAASQTGTVEGQPAEHAAASQTGTVEGQPTGQARKVEGQPAGQAGTVEGQPAEHAAPQTGTVEGQPAEHAAATQSPADPAAGHTVGSLLSDSQIRSLGEQLKAIPGLADNVNLFREGQLAPGTSAAQILLAVRDALGGTAVLDKRTITRLFGSKAFGALMKDALEQQWMVRPEELGKGDKKIDALYEKLESQISRMEEVVRATGKESVDFTQAAAEIRNNVDFMDQLNTTYTYAQIPLKMTGQNASGELFVYTNKKHLARDGDKDLTAFLHLDLENLGSTDISVRLHGREVSTNFYLEDDASFELVQKYLPRLEERLERKGYTCTISVTNEKKQVNFVEDFLKKDQPSAGQQLHRYSFDMRA